MISQGPTDIAKFFVAGINYKKADASVRGKYAISKNQYANLFSLAPGFNVKELFVLSTCNRTEIYGFADEALTLCRLLCTQTEGSLDDFSNMAYIKNGAEAVEHLFDVAAGLDSQILGDYEIIGQIKTAVKFSREHDFIDVFTDRLVNAVLQSSKNIKTNTELSGGTVSVSFAAVQYIKENISDITAKKILLLGTGKIGRNTCKNLVDYLGTKNITLINRTEEKAEALAKELGLQFALSDELEKQVNAADIILVATNSDEPVILKSHVENSSQKLIIDLSIPYNVETGAQYLPNITLKNVDELSKIKDQTLQKRQAEVPKAKAIIAGHRAEFLDWHQMRRHVPVLKAVKTKLREIHTSPLLIPLYSHNISRISADEKIQRVINGMASKMKIQNQKGCQYIEAINEFMATGTN
jgi:glutamyl-tRNA reductase